jgi:hypothetical protein
MPDRPRQLTVGPLVPWPPHRWPSRAVEESTDLAAARPWARLGPDRVADLLAVLRPVARACAADLPYPNPVGMPPPAS